MTVYNFKYNSDIINFKVFKKIRKVVIESILNKVHLSLIEFRRTVF